MTKIKEYIEYRHNKKIVKRELVKLGATALPTISQTVTQSADIMNFITHLVKEVENVGADEFIKTVREEIVSYIVDNIPDKDKSDEE